MRVLLIPLLHLAVLLPSRAARGVPRATSKFVDASNLKWLGLQGLPSLRSPRCASCASAALAKQLCLAGTGPLGV